MWAHRFDCLKVERSTEHLVHRLDDPLVSKKVRKAIGSLGGLREMLLVN
jgi:hypothetical protein